MQRKNVKEFLEKYLRFAHAFYFTLGITIAPLCAQWFWPSLDKNCFIFVAVITFALSLVVSIIIHFIIQNVIWKAMVTIVYSLLIVSILLPVFEFSPYILAILGIMVLSTTMHFFNSVKEIFPEIDNQKISRWLEVTLTLFAIFVSSMMVGFTIAWNNLYGEALKGLIERRIVIVGIDSNLLITMYFWGGAGLIFLSGIKYLGSAANERG